MLPLAGGEVIRPVGVQGEDHRPVVLDVLLHQGQQPRLQLLCPGKAQGAVHKILLIIYNYKYLSHCAKNLLFQAKSRFCLYFIPQRGGK